MAQSKIESKLAAMGLDLPPPLPNVGAYVPYQVSGSLVFISGQVPMKEDRLICGQIGAELSQTQGYEAARYCALALLAQLKEACQGDLDRAISCIRLGGFVNAVAGFGNHPEVINGASDLLVALMGESGCHSRFAVGVSSLPRQCAVEVDAIFEIR